MKFVSLEKMSKKKQAEFHKAQRNTWGNLNPTSRRHKSDKDFHRVKRPTRFYLEEV